MKNIIKKNKTDFLLDGFTDKELRGFDNFVRTSYNKPDIISFWNLRYSGITKSKGKNNNKTETLKNSAGKEYTRKFLSDFNKILESYYIRIAVEKDEPGKMIYLLRELRIRNIDKLFSELLKDIKKYHKHKIQKGYTNNITMLRSYYEEYFLFNALNEEENMLKISGQINDISQNILLQKSLFENINNKLYGVETKNRHEYLVSYDAAVNFISSKPGYFKSNQENIFILYRISSLIDNSGDENEIKAILKYLKSNYKKFTIDFLKHIYEDLIRYMVLRINLGKKESLVLAFHTISDIEKRGLIKKMNHIQPMNFFAIVNVAAHLREFEFAEKFIREYDCKIALTHRNDVIKISRAMLEFARGNYGSAKTLLIESKVKNLTLYLFAKTTLIKSLYERNELRAISSISDTVKHFFNRKKEMKDKYRNSIFKFLSYTNRLAYARRTSGKGLMQISDDLSSEKTFFQKKWIEEKLAQLIT